jgi:chromosome partitioning protein
MIYAVLNQKGGVGKSTITVNLAYGLAQAGKRTLLVDLDPQAHTSIIYCPEIPKELTTKEIFTDRSLDPYQLIRPAVVNGEPMPRLFIIPSNIRLAITAEQITVRTHREKLIYNHLKRIVNDFDVILIDCPPNLGVLTINAIYAAEYIIIPTIYGKYSLDGIADLFSSIAEVKETESFQYWILRNAFDARNKQTNQFIENQLEPFSTNLLKTIIRKTEAINQAQINNEPVFTFDPRGNGTQDFAALTQEILMSHG